MAKTRGFVITNLKETLNNFRTKESFLRKLSHVECTDSFIRVEDVNSNTTWISENSNLLLSRDHQGVTATASTNFILPNSSPSLKANGFFAFEDSRISLELEVADVIPKDISEVFSGLQAFSGFGLPVSGNIVAETNLDGFFDMFRFDIVMKQGKISLPSPINGVLSVEDAKLFGIYKVPDSIIVFEKGELNLNGLSRFELQTGTSHELPIDRISFSTKYSAKKRILEISELLVGVENVGLNIDGIIKGDVMGVTFALSASFEQLKAELLKKYWGKDIYPKVRTWVNKNLINGIIYKGKLELSGQSNSSTDIKLQSFNGSFYFKNLDLVDSNSGEDLKGGTGKLSFTRDDVSLILNKLTSEDLVVQKGRLFITKLTGDLPLVEVFAEIDGSILSTWRLLTNTMKEEEKIDLSGYDLVGNGQTFLHLTVPLASGNKIGPEKFFLSSVLTEVSANGLAYDKRLSQGDLFLSIRNKGMSLIGSARIDDVPVNLSWKRSFEGIGNPIHSYRMFGEIGVKQFSQLFNLNLNLLKTKSISGNLNFEAEAEIRKNENGILRTKLDLNKVKMSIPEFGWVKSKNVPLKGLTSIKFNSRGIQDVPVFDFIGEGSALIGNIKFENGEFVKINFRTLELGRNKLNGTAENKLGNWLVKLNGPHLDLSTFLYFDDVNLKKYNRGPKFEIKLDIDRVEVRPGKFLRGVTGNLINDGLIWTALDLSSSYDSSEKLKIKLEQKNTKRILRIESNNAGALLNTFDLYTDIVGGSLILKAEFEDMTYNSRVSGEANITKFRLVDAPILARLLSIASITGIVNQLSGTGLYFQHLNVPFKYHNGLVDFSNARAGGWSLGFTANGMLDIDSETIEMNGSIAPLDKVNSLFGNIPVIGSLFSGGEKGRGVFAAEYAISGPVDEPEIKTNPLTALTPGIFKKIFDFVPGVGLNKKRQEWEDLDEPN